MDALGSSKLANDIVAYDGESARWNSLSECGHGDLAELAGWSRYRPVFSHDQRRCVGMTLHQT